MSPEYAKLMGLTATQGKSAMPGPLDVGAKLWEHLRNPFYDNGPNDKGLGIQLAYSIGRVFLGYGLAVLFAVPIGLFAAIYMAEYASPRLRSTAKPLLEVLAGIPTIVYGFFALVTVGPFLRDISAQMNGLMTGNYQNFIQAQSVLTAGIVMGIMLIPFVSSLSDLQWISPTAID